MYSINRHLWYIPNPKYLIGGVPPDGLPGVLRGGCEVLEGNGLTSFYLIIHIDRQVVWSVEVRVPGPPTMSRARVGLVLSLSFSDSP